MARVFGWSPTEMREREDAFAALVDKKIISWTKWARSKVVASSKVLVAAGGAAAPATEPVPPPPVDLGAVGAITGLWHGSVSADIMPALSEVYLTSASTVWQGIDEAFTDLAVPSVSDQFAEDYLAKASNRLVAIGDMVWTNIRQELLTGFSLGESVPKLADRVSAAGQVSLKRANVIARTEVNAASNAGAHQQVLISGLVGTKEWLDTNDERTRCTHRAAGGQTVDFSHAFTLGGPDCGVGLAYLQFPGDPTGPPSEIIQCRCSVAYDLDLPPGQNDVLTAAVDFVESEHPRAPDGKFTHGASRLADAVSGRDALAHIPFSVAGELKARNQKDYDSGRQRHVDAAREWLYVPNAQAINASLRGTREPDSDIQQRVAALDEIMASSHTTHDIKVERGVGDLGEMFGAAANGDLTGVEYTDRGFISTTAEPGRVERLATEFRKAGVGSWQQPAKITLFVPKGTPAMAPLDRIGEVTLDRGLHYRVRADHGVDEHGVRQLEVEVVP